MEYRAIVFNSARDGNLRRLQVFLDGRSPELVKSLIETNTFGTPPLVIAARNGHLDVVKYLLSKSVDTNISGTVAFDGETIECAPAIWAASAAGHVHVVEALLNAGVDVNQTTSSNSTALRGACYDGHLDVVICLVRNKANVEIGNRHKHTPLMIAAYREQTQIVRYLLSIGANPNAVSSKGNTALHDASEAGNVEIAQMLLDAGGRIERDEYGMTPILSAAMVGHRDVVSLFLTMCSRDEQIDALKLIGSTYVDKRRDLSSAIAVWRDAVRLQAGQTSDIVNKPSSSVYGYRCEIDSESSLDEIVGDPEALRMQALLIRERILGRNHPETHYYLRYRGAIYADIGQFERCFQLWMHALDLQQSYLEPLNPMTQATILAFTEIFSYMLNERSLSRKADATRMMLTVEHIVAVLDRTIDEVARVGDDHIHVDECHHRFIVVCLYLVELIGRIGPIVDERPMLQSLHRLIATMKCANDGSSALHIACADQSHAGDGSRYPTARFPSLFVVQRLLQVGADVRSVNSKGETPLHVLLRNRHPRASIARCLLKHGAPILARTNDNYTCFELLRRPMLVNDVMRLQVKPMRYISLQGFAANAIRRCSIEFYRDILPVHLHILVDRH